MIQLLKRAVRSPSECDAAMGEHARILAELGMQEPLLFMAPFEIEVSACAALGGKTVVTTTITRELKRS